MSQKCRAYQVGERLRGRVEKVLPYGIFVRLNDDTPAYIRRRELTWAGNIDPRELYRAGEEIEGLVCKLAETGQCLELSHRATLADPWDEFAHQVQPGDVVEGTVKSVVGYGIYVELVAGIDGLIPLKELATWPVSQPEAMFWIGDKVEAVITHLDHHHHKLRLSIRARLRQLETVSKVLEHFELPSILTPNFDPSLPSFSSQTHPQEIVSELQPETAPPIFDRIGRILIVDDHEELRLPLVKWLQYRGCQVDASRDIQEATEKTQRESYGLLFVDLNLPETDGLTFLRYMRQTGLKCPAVIMSTIEWLAERSSEIEEVGVIEVFLKPLDLDEIESLLIRLERGEILPQWRMTPLLTPHHIPESFSRLAGTVRRGGSLAQQLRAGLQQLVATTPAEMGLIFNLNPVSGGISITAQAGKIQLNEEAIYELGASPVRDVIEEGICILENQMQGNTRERFRKLLDLLPFESCLGAPIEAGGVTHRAVFLLHREPGVFNRYHLRDALAASKLFAVMIEREAIEQRSRSANKLLLSGQLAGGFSHEVYNKMSGLEIQLRNLQATCHMAEGQPDSLGEINQATHELLATFTDLKNTVELFQQLMRTEEDQEINVNEIIQKTLSLLKPLLHKERIKVETDLELQLPQTTGNLTQLQQVFLNITLNAIQHMTIRADGSRILNISALCHDRNTEHPIQIRFADTGPGIHYKLWEKVFDLGFTTRLGGTGEGLYIARSLVESAGGKIKVERSIIPIGTTFLVELPVIAL